MTCVSFSCWVVSNSFGCCGLEPTRLLCPSDFPARILEWVAISSSRGSSQPRDGTHIFCIGIGRWVLYHWATWEAPNDLARKPLSLNCWNITPFLSLPLVLPSQQGGCPCGESSFSNAQLECHWPPQSHSASRKTSRLLNTAHKVWSHPHTTTFNPSSFCPSSPLPLHSRQFNFLMVHALHHPFNFELIFSI